jgi:phosphoglycerol transferase
MGKKKRNKSAQASGSGAVATEIRQVAGSRPQGFSVAAETKTSFFSSRYFEWLALAVASVVSYWILTARLTGVNVSVLVDEYSYVLDAHYRALSETAYPNHLFQLFYSATKACGPEFYTCARSLNALFVVGSGLIVYFFAKYISKKYWIASAGFVVTVFGSLGTYTAYFMPEAIFNFFMVAFFYALFRFSSSNNLLVWAGMGAILGIASLAKPHAFFVVPALVVYIVLLTRATEPKFFLSASKRLLASGLALVGTKFAIGFAIAGERGLSIFGSYGGAIATGEAVATTLGVNTWANVPVTAWGQILMITMILGFSLPVAILGLLESLKKDKQVFLANRFRALFALALLNMMAVVAVFEAWQNLTNWMHTRYNSYLIPLAIIVLVEAYIHFNRTTGKLPKRVTVGGFTFISLFALFTAAIPYGANWVDAPDFKAHIDNLVISSIAIMIAIVLGLWWLWNTKIPVLVGIVFMVGSSLFSGTHISNFLQATFGQDTTYDHLGRVLRDLLPQDQRDSTLLIGDNNTAMERALFVALTGGASSDLIAPGEELSLSDVADSTSWVVKVGDPLISGFGEPILSGLGFRIYSLEGVQNIEPVKNNLTNVTNSCGSPEDLGWICGPGGEVSFDGYENGFTKVDLILEVSATASQGELEFTMGDQILKGTLPEGVFAVSLKFSPQKSGLLSIGGSGEAANSTSKSSRLVKVISVTTSK